MRIYYSSQTYDRIYKSYVTPTLRSVVYDVRLIFRCHREDFWRPITLNSSAGNTRNTRELSSGRCIEMFPYLCVAIFFSREFGLPVRFLGEQYLDSFYEILSVKFGGYNLCEWFSLVVHSRVYFFIRNCENTWYGSVAETPRENIVRKPIYFG